MQKMLWATGVVWTHVLDLLWLGFCSAWFCFSRRCLHVIEAKSVGLGFVLYMMYEFMWCRWLLVAVEAAASLVVVELLQQHLLGEGHRQLMHLQLRRKRKRRKRVMTIWDSHSLISASLYTQVFILWPNISRTFCIWGFPGRLMLSLVKRIFVEHLTTFEFLVWSSYMLKFEFSLIWWWMMSLVRMGQLELLIESIFCFLPLKNRK